jgi:hypothetical protein
MLKNSIENNTIEIFLEEENIPVKERICIRRSKLRACVLTGKTLAPDILPDTAIRTHRSE